VSFSTSFASAPAEISTRAIWSDGRLPIEFVDRDTAAAILALGTWFGFGVEVKTRTQQDGRRILKSGIRWLLGLAVFKSTGDLPSSVESLNFGPGQEEGDFQF